MTITALAMAGANPAEFTRKGTCAVDSTLAPGASCTLALSFTPAAVGTRTATLGVTTSAGTLNVALSGTGKKTGRK
jgi:hypothetical protein